MLQWVWCSGTSLAQCIAWPIDLSSTVGRGIVPSLPPCGLLARHSTCCSAYAWPCCNILTDSCPCECPMCAKARVARSTDAVCRARRKRRGWIRARIPMGRTTSSRSKHVGSCRSRMVSSICKRPAESVPRVAKPVGRPCEPPQRKQPRSEPKYSRMAPAVARRAQLRRNGKMWPLGAHV